MPPYPDIDLDDGEKTKADAIEDMRAELAVLAQRLGAPGDVQLTGVINYMNEWLRRAEGQNTVMLQLLAAMPRDLLVRMYDGCGSTKTEAKWASVLLCTFKAQNDCLKYRETQIQVAREYMRLTSKVLMTTTFGDEVGGIPWKGQVKQAVEQAKQSLDEDAGATRQRRMAEAQAAVQAAQIAAAAAAVAGQEDDMSL